MRRILAVLALVLVSSAAYGEITVKQYHFFKAKGWHREHWFQSYVSGMGEGFVAMNTVLEAGGRKRVYCGNMPLQVVNYLMILDEELRLYKPKENVPISIPLLIGLADKFPCQ
jgi:hypothetical protein